MSRRWIVQPNDPTSLNQILLQMEDPHALEQGRVFLGKTRVVDGNITLRPGDQITLYPARTIHQKPKILAKRDGVVALFKPSDLPTIADHRGQLSLLQWACDQLKQPDLHTTSRLDIGVSGVLLLARDRAARERLAFAREHKTYHRTYLALVSPGSPGSPGSPSSPSEGTWRWAIGKGKGNLQIARPEGTQGVPDATTHFSTVMETPRVALLKVTPITGRTHQIRVHCAHAGRPIFGDSSYGGITKVVAPDGSITRTTRIGLHALRVQTPDRQGNLWQVEAPIPEDFLALWRALSDEPFPKIP